MNNLSKLTFLLLPLFPLTACEDKGDELEVVEQPVPEGFALSAGNSTVFLTSTYAYDANSDWVRGELAARFRDGDGLYDDALTSSSGLGPVYAGYACGSCHRNAGRTTPSV